MQTHIIRFRVWLFVGILFMSAASVASACDEGYYECPILKCCPNSGEVGKRLDPTGVVQPLLDAAGRVIKWVGKEAGTPQAAQTDAQFAKTKEEIVKTKEEVLQTKKELVTTKEEVSQIKKELVATKEEMDIQRKLMEKNIASIAQKISDESLKKAEKIVGEFAEAIRTLVIVIAVLITFVIVFLVLAFKKFSFPARIPHAQTSST